MYRALFDIKNYSFPNIPTELDNLIFSYLTIPRTIKEFASIVKQGTLAVDLISIIKQYDCLYLLTSIYRKQFIVKINKMFDNWLFATDQKLKKGCTCKRNFFEYEYHYHSSMEYIENTYRDCNFISRVYKKILTSENIQKLNDIVKIIDSIYDTKNGYRN
jgi:hypothetical protein